LGRGGRPQSQRGDDIGRTRESRGDRLLCAVRPVRGFRGDYRLEAGTPILGQRILLDVIGAAVIGEVRLFGGKGTVIGVLFLSAVDNGLQLLGLSLSSV